MRRIIEDYAKTPDAMERLGEQVIHQFERNARTSSRRPGAPFNANLPFHLKQEFTALTMQLKATYPVKERADVTMTEFVIAAIEAVIIPGIKRELEKRRGQGTLYDDAAA